MSKADLNMIKEWGMTIENITSKKMKEQIMAGGNNLTQSTGKPKIAVWTKKVVDKLDKLVNKKDRIKIMEKCGYNCSKVNSRVIDNILKKRKKFDTLEDFLRAEEKNPHPGTKLEYKGNIIYQYYTPGNFTRPMRCYCSLFRGLPKEQKVSITYCHCSKAFVSKYWEAILEKPVKVELLESAISGSQVCKFAIYI